MLFGDDWLSLGGVLDSMVDDLVVIYSLCLIADFCPLGEAVFCVSDSRGVRRTSPLLRFARAPKKRRPAFFVCA